MKTQTTPYTLMHTPAALRPKQNNQISKKKTCIDAKDMISWLEKNDCWKQSSARCSIQIPGKTMHRKSMIILTVWLLVIGIIGLILMIGLIFYLLYTINFFGSYALHFPKSYEHAVVFAAAESCFSYYDPTIQRWYPSLLDLSLINDQNLTTCIGTAYGVKAVLNADGIRAQAQTPLWKTDDSAKQIPVILYDPTTKIRQKANLIISITIDDY